jgi:GNAT superfamily N-acetyltransferase
MRGMATVREFQDRDQDAVIGLSLRAWAPVFASLAEVLGENGIFTQMHPDWRADQSRAVRAACHTEGMRVWVAEHEGGVAGFVAARLDRAESMGEVYMIAVDPEHQGAGIGASLMERALAWLRDSGMALVMVETGGDPGHAPARRLYERAGFTKLPVARYFMRL